MVYHIWYSLLLYIYIYIIILFYLDYIYIHIELNAIILLRNPQRNIAITSYLNIEIIRSNV